jgi:hypothetical protein
MLLSCKHILTLQVLVSSSSSHCDATCPSASKPLPPGPSSHTGPKSLIGISRLGNSRLLDAQDHSLYKTPNPDSSGSCATCPRYDRRLRSIREIAGRDFKEVELLPPGNAERRIPILRDPAPRVPSPINGSDRFGESQLAISRGVELSPRHPPNAETPKSDGL